MECGLVIGMVSIEVLHDQPSDIYSSDTDNPLLVVRLYRVFHDFRA
jgi:hypothetical protein